MKKATTPKLPKSAAAPRKKKKKAGHNHKYFMFFLAFFVAVGFISWQFKADANPVADAVTVTPVMSKAPASKAFKRVNYVELKHR